MVYTKAWKTQGRRIYFYYVCVEETRTHVCIGVMGNQMWMEQWTYKRREAFGSFPSLLVGNLFNTVIHARVLCFTVKEPLICHRTSFPSPELSSLVIDIIISKKFKCAVTPFSPKFFEFLPSDYQELESIAPPF